jgi:hypothetical protein
VPGKVKELWRQFFGIVGDHGCVKARLSIFRIQIVEVGGEIFVQLFRGLDRKVVFFGKLVHRGFGKDFFAPLGPGRGSDYQAEVKAGLAQGLEDNKRIC